MNFLSIFVLIPLLMLAGLWAARGIKAIRGVMVTGASALLIPSYLHSSIWENVALETRQKCFSVQTRFGMPRFTYLIQ